MAFSAFVDNAPFSFHKTLFSGITILFFPSTIRVLKGNEGLAKKVYECDLTRDAEMMVNKYKTIVLLMATRGALTLHHSHVKTLNQRAAFISSEM